VDNDGCANAQPRNADLVKGFLHLASNFGLSFFSEDVNLTVNQFPSAEA